MMNLPTNRHEDERRTLVEYIHDLPFRTSKVLFVKQDSVLGNHYHKLKDDIFFLVKGSGTYTIDGHEEIFSQGDCIFVKAGMRHSFKLFNGSILLESSTLPYDKGDEHEV